MKTTIPPAEILKNVEKHEFELGKRILYRQVIGTRDNRASRNGSNQWKFIFHFHHPAIRRLPLLPNPFAADDGARN